MGLLRLLLAVAVVLAHLPVRPLMTGGALAVEAFFMISGFYVALVLERNYRRPQDFYVNRYLRLAPAYLVVAGSSLASWLLFDVKPFPESTFMLKDWGYTTVGFLALTNATMLFQDAAMFMCPAKEGLAWVSNFRSCSPPMYGALLVPQAWSLGLELCFYALAPWLLRLRTPWLLAIVTASLVTKGALALSGLSHDPWSYRFFPSELHLFVIGALAYRGREGKIFRITGLAAHWKTWGMVFFSLMFSFLPFGRGFHYVFLIALFLSLPVLFDFSTTHSWDRKIGELSYPLYIVHILVISWLKVLMSGGPYWLFSLVGICGSLLGAIILYQMVDLPMERVRSARRKVLVPISATA